MLLFSIIVPIYNVEECIETCFKSLLSQNIEKELYEIIAINDGSTDNSINILKLYLNSNIKIINKTNGGVSSARNIGLKKAKGKYIIFVDPDDAISSDALLNLKLRLKEPNDNHDIIIMKSFDNKKQKENYSWDSLFSENKNYTSIELYTKNYIRGSVCGCAFRRNFLLKQEILFPIGIINSEDTIFFTIAQSKAKKISFFNINFYLIIGRNNSASYTYSTERIKSYIKSLDYVKKHIHYHCINNNQKDLFMLLLYMLISNITYTLVNLPHTNYKYIVNELNINSYLPLTFNKYPNKKIKIFLLNKAYFIYYTLLKIKNLATKRFSLTRTSK